MYLYTISVKNFKTPCLYRINCFLWKNYLCRRFKKTKESCKIEIILTDNGSEFTDKYIEDSKENNKKEKNKKRKKRKIKKRKIINKKRKINNI